MKQLNNDNAANRNSYIGYVHNIGEKKIKEDILKSLPKEWKNLHDECYIHIHDLDAYGFTYNCLTFNILANFPYEEYTNLNDAEKIVKIFFSLVELFTNMGNEQSGGMAFANFDCEIGEILKKLNISLNENNKNLIVAIIKEFIIWCNNNHTRMGQTSYYITLNIGLANDDYSRFIAYTLLDEFEKLGCLVYKPNIVFKVCKNINRDIDSPNYYLLKKALLCTAKKMIPTYLLCDSKMNSSFDPYKLDVMGCRTRVTTDLYGNDGTIGRGNIANISINLPKLALEIGRDYRNADVDTKIKYFKDKWLKIASIVKDILLDRYKKLCSKSKDDFPTNLAHQLWCTNFNDAKNLEEIFKHGTLSIGFIGISEAIELLTGRKYYADMENYLLTYSFINYMDEYINFLKTEYKLNFSLLATAGELISGRFIDNDKTKFKPTIDIFKKGYYTNSFHIDVDSNIQGYKKIQLEGLFHEKCKGGCITYIELGEAPIANDEGLLEYIDIAVDSNANYLGFNFPMDVCKKCNISGIFDICPKCKSKNIIRIRRVSGYLEILDGFTKGKKNEEKNRRAN